MERDIIRQPTSEELRSYIDVPLQTPGTNRVLTPKDKLNKTLADEQQKAMKKGLPFAEAAARADVKDIVETFTKAWKRQGYVDKDYKFPTIDWSKYSDLKNFEVLDEGATHDKDLSKLHRLPVFVQYKKYQFKGFSNTYTVMESAEDATQRALRKIENRKVEPVEKK